MYKIGYIGYVLRTFAGLNSAFIFGLLRVLKPLSHTGTTLATPTKGFCPYCCHNNRETKVASLSFHFRKKSKKRTLSLLAL